MSKITTEINRFEIINQVEDPKERLDLWLDLLRELGGDIAVLRNQFAQYWLPAMRERYEADRIDTEYIMQQIRELKLDSQEAV